VIKDANGVFVGVLSGEVALRKVGDTVVEILATPQGFPQGLLLYHESADCSGPGVMVAGGRTSFSVPGQILGTTLYYPSTPGSLVTAFSLSSTPVDGCQPPAFIILPDTCCQPLGAHGAPGNFAPFTTTALSGFTPPFHLEVEP